MFFYFRELHGASCTNKCNMRTLPSQRGVFDIMTHTYPFPTHSPLWQVLASPMHSILSRLQLQDHQLQEHINIVYFSDDVILNKSIEEWPLCDCLISFYSKGFPLDKAIAYVNLRHPFVINDLEMQYSLMDRYCMV